MRENRPVELQYERFSDEQERWDTHLALRPCSRSQQYRFDGWLVECRRGRFIEPDELPKWMVEMEEGARVVVEEHAKMEEEQNTRALVKFNVAEDVEGANRFCVRYVSVYGMSVS